MLNIGVLFLVLPVIISAAVCPDGNTCQDSRTCCQTVTTGKYGCCPLQNTSPEGNQINGEAVSEHLNAVICPDEESECPEDTTCCQLPDGSWGCCPMPKAVCCSDRRHCCPHGAICDLAHYKCVSPTVGEVPMKEKFLSRRKTIVHSFGKHGKGVPCNDSVACPDSSTCCKTAKGDWACCPLPKAVCCDDHIHCCPYGTACNLAAGTCDNSTGPVLWLEKQPVVAPQLHPSSSDKCDEQTSCPSGTTCCKQESGDWACCPLPHAVCCDDHKHCCPKGYQCDVSQQICTKPGALSLPCQKKLAAQKTSLPTDLVQCDSRTSCPRHTTCCYMHAQGKWGCCPLEQAVCCEDGEYCCPHNYKCSERQTCHRGSVVIPMYKKVEALTQSDSLTDTKCDEQSSCPTGTTCCKLPTGEWGCCPLVKAVCCSDMKHCCPAGYSCDTKTETCIQANLLSWVKSFSVV